MLSYKLEKNLEDVNNPVCFLTHFFMDEGVKNDNLGLLSTCTHIESQFIVLRSNRFYVKTKDVHSSNKTCPQNTKKIFCLQKMRNLPFRGLEGTL